MKIIDNLSLKKRPCHYYFNTHQSKKFLFTLFISKIGMFPIVGCMNLD